MNKIIKVAAVAALFAATATASARWGGGYPGYGWGGYPGWGGWGYPGYGYPAVVAPAAPATQQAK